MFQTTLTIVINTSEPIDTEEKRIKIGREIASSIRSARESYLPKSSILDGEVIVPKIGKAGDF